MSWAPFIVLVLVLVVLAIAVVKQGHRLRRLQFGTWVAEFDPADQMGLSGQTGSDMEPADHQAEDATAGRDD